MTVSANIRYSKQLPGGAWKGLELSVEAALEGQDTWTEAQATLYDELGQQLKVLWDKNGRSPEPTERPLEAPHSHANDNGVSQHYCDEHGAEFRRYGKSGRVWYSHKGPGDKWCKEKA